MKIKNSINDLVILGGKNSLFDKPLPVGQLNFPDWDKFEKKMKGIFDRQYYTNHGPLVKELEQRLESFLNVKHAVCMTNATLALAMSAQTLGLKGQIILPSFTFIASAQSMSLAGLEPIFCDVDLETTLISPETVKKALGKGANISSIMGVHLWGNSCHSEELQALADSNNLQILYDAAQAFGCTHENTPIAQFGKISVFSFHATKILNAAEGGVACTNDDLLAEKLRNTRSSYGVRTPMPVPYTGNGRMSEAQAGLALLSLDDYKSNQERNKSQLKLYSSKLKSTPGISIIPHTGNNHNFQYMVIRVDSKEFGVGRDHLLNILQNENIIARKYFNPAAHEAIPFNLVKYDKEDLPNTYQLCSSLLQLPLGGLVDLNDIEHIAQLINFIHSNAKGINSKVNL